MKNTRISLILAAAVMAPSLTFAAPAADFDGASAKPAAFDAGLTAGFHGLSKRLAMEQPSYTLPRNPVDAFKAEPACSVVDAMYLRAFDLDEAVRVLAPCFQALSKRYAVSIAPAKGMVALSEGRGEAMGIMLRVAGVTFIGNHVMYDLDYSLKLRRGTLLGFPASLGRTINYMKSAPIVPSWVDASSLYMEPRQTSIANGTLRVVLFDKYDDQVELDAPVTDRLDSAQATVDFTKADDEEVGPLPVGSVQASAAGGLGRMLASVSIPAGLDAATKTAVFQLFSALSR
ncbi:MAG: hypothetical protein KGL53_08470 [Elusimicrobia bacterium]|nr:hypothetical protein [Elusimicrobiota bacterium]